MDAKEKIVSFIHAKNKDEIEKLNLEGLKQMEKMTIFLNKAIIFDPFLIKNVFIATEYYLKFKFNSDENLMEFESKESSLLNPDKKFFLYLVKIGDYSLFKTIR